MDDCVIRHDSVIDYSILDKEVVVETGGYVGFGDDFQVNRKEPKVLNTGVTIVGKRARIFSKVKIGRNCAIHSGVEKNDLPGSEIISGETIKPKKSRPAPKK